MEQKFLISCDLNYILIISSPQSRLFSILLLLKRILCGKSIELGKSNKNSTSKTHYTNILKDMKSPFVVLNRLKLSGLEKSVLYSHSKLEEKDHISENNTEMVGHIPCRGTSQRRCVNCKTKGKTSRTIWFCKACGKNLCCQKKSKITCFYEFHSLELKLKNFVLQEETAVEILPVSYQSEENSLDVEFATDKNIIGVDLFSKINIQNVDEEHVHVIGTSKRKCACCKINGKTTFTLWECKGCKFPLCIRTPGVSCFTQFHSIFLPSNKIPYSASPDSNILEV
ncbi:hypothetical protein NPIL_225151 [Nephila pilipes]|uniref:Uncharacterized protein n=1 Tax=Nephila pilipes TaxID=299642 RepID=A0A8X6TF67_NEPPI|nr:hypothetical protein NPIL_225151 [Nephila pilipes]